MEILEAIADERRRVAGLLESLTPDQLDAPSLCGDWTVKQVAGHLLAAVDVPTSALLRLIPGSAFTLHRANARLAVIIARRPAGEMAAALRDGADNPARSPIVG